MVQNNAFAISSPNLGTASNFAVLGHSTVTNTGSTVIIGNLGLSPGTSITGSPGTVPGTTHIADGAAAQAQNDATAAKTALTSATCTTNEPSVANIGGQMLSPGVYCFPSSAAITGTLTLSGSGVYIFKIASTLVTAAGPGASNVVLTNGATANNVFWAVGSSATLGTYSVFKGTIIATASITATTGATVNGRLLAQTGAVTLDTNTVTIPVTLSSILITTPATKLSYTVGNALDTTGLVVTGTFSDGSTRVVTPDSVTGFNSLAPVTGQVLTIHVGSRTTTYTSNVVAAPISYVSPNPPLQLIATYSPTQINLSWSAPISNNSPSLTAYKIIYAVDNGGFQDLVSRNPTITSYSHTNLMPGHVYAYAVFALNSAGTSNPSNVVTQTTVQGTTVPTSPTSLSAVASPPTSIFLSWNSPQSNGGSSITGYKIEYTTPTVQWLVLTSNTGNTQQAYYQTGIDTSKTYYYRVSAINSNGVGSPSNTASSIASSSTIMPVSGIAISPTQVNLSWAAPSNTYGQIISGYKIEQKSGNSYINIVENTGLVTSYPISGLTTGTTYTFRITALFVGGTSSTPSTDVLVTPTSTSYIQTSQQNNLPAGSSVYLGQQSPGNINSVVFSNSGPQTQYFSSPSAQVTGIWTTVSTSVNGAVLYFDSNGNTYSTAISPNSNTLTSFYGPMSVSNVRMSIQNRGYSNDMGSVAYVDSVNQQSQAVPDAPQSLFAGLNSQNNVAFSWTAPQDNGKPPISGYKVEYKTSSYGSWLVLNQNIGLSTLYVHSGLSPSTTYTYRVLAINSAGTSTPSNEASVTTGHFTNTMPTLSQVSAGTIPIVNTDTAISYVISGGQVYGATVNKDARSLDFQLQGKAAGALYLQLPRTLIDAKQSDGSDRTFYVIVDNKNVQFNETKTGDYRALAISFPANANKMSIIGTVAAPEFPIALIGLVIGLVPAMIISRRCGKF